MSLALITTGIFLGFLLLGLWGDVVIGAIIVGAARLAEAADTLRRKELTRGRPGRQPATPRHGDVLH